MLLVVFSPQPRFKRRLGIRLITRPNPIFQPRGGAWRFLCCR